MITGYNTDVEHDGVIYHVQTEDKGMESPLILSLVYSGGEILASKRSRYEDLIAAGFNEAALAERLKRQHSLICAAILAGRVGDLKRMTARDADLERRALRVEQKAEPEATTIGTPPLGAEPVEVGAGSEPPRKRSEVVASEAEAYTVHDSRRQSPLGESQTSSEGLRVTLLDEQEFRSGDALTLRIRVSYCSSADEKPMGGVLVTVKVLGTSFRPQITSEQTQRDGVAIVSAQIPEFTSGRAAILIRASAKGDTTEMRRVVHPA